MKIENRPRGQKTLIAFSAVFLLIGILLGASIAYGQDSWGTLTTLGGGYYILEANGHSVGLYARDNEGSPADLAGRLDLRNTNPGYTKLMLSPNGRPGPWTTLLQLANTDTFGDNGNYEILELTWEGNYSYINVFANGTGVQRDFALMLDGTPMFKMAVGNESYGEDQGELYIWVGRPFHMVRGGAGEWTEPINITTTNSTGPGSPGDPFGATTTSIIAQIPTGYEIASGKTVFCVYCESISFNSYALVTNTYENGIANNTVTIDSLALSRQYLEDNRLDIVVWNWGDPYTLVTNWLLNIELRY